MYKKYKIADPQQAGPSHSREWDNDLTVQYAVFARQ